MTDLDLQGLTLSVRIASPPLDVLASAFTFLGDIELTGTAALLLAVVGGRRRGWRGLAPLLLFVGLAVEILLKNQLVHPGPPDGRQLWHLPLEFMEGYQSLSLTQPLIPILHYSFPSGHVFRCTFLAGLVAQWWPRYRYGAWGVVVAMAFTRVALNEHWISDVAGGLLLGGILTATASIFTQGLHRPAAPDRPSL